MHDNPSPSVTGRVALITGAARRLGAAIARHLHAAGMNVVVHYHRSGEAARALTEELNAARGGSALALKANLLHETALEPLVTEAADRWGRLDALINNASAFYPTPLAGLRESQWEELLGSNLKAPLFLARAAAPQLRRERGAIVNLIDVNVERPPRDHAVYIAAKAGLAGLTRALAVDLAPEVRVNGIAPGAILWPEPEPPEAARRALLETVPLGRLGEPADVARAVLYLLRDAPYVTGQILAVDGGRSLGGG